MHQLLAVFRFYNWWTPLADNYQELNLNLTLNKLYVPLHNILFCRSDLCIVFCLSAMTSPTLLCYSLPHDSYLCQWFLLLVLPAPGMDLPRERWWSTQAPIPGSQCRDAAGSAEGGRALSYLQRRERVDWERMKGWGGGVDLFQFDMLLKVTGYTAMRGNGQKQK